MATNRLNLFQLQLQLQLISSNNKLESDAQLIIKITEE